MDAILSRQWRDRAACQGEWELMDTAQPDKWAQAVAFGLCASCPVLAQCRQWVESEPHFEGIAAGHLWSARSVRNQRLEKAS